jgi:anti-anti-sigma factor
MDLQTRQITVAGTTVLVLSGEIDLATLPKLADALTRLAAVDASVAVDLDGVHVLDDAALGLLLGTAGRMRRRNHDLVVVCSSSGLRERLADTGFDRAVRVVERITAP